MGLYKQPMGCIAELSGPILCSAHSMSEIQCWSCLQVHHGLSLIELWIWISDDPMAGRLDSWQAPGTYVHRIYMKMLRKQRKCWDGQL